MSQLTPVPRPSMGQVFRRSHEPGKWQYARVTGFQDQGTALRKVPGQAEPEKVEMWSAVISDGFTVTEVITHITLAGKGFWEPVEDEGTAHVVALEQGFSVMQKLLLETVSARDLTVTRTEALEMLVQGQRETIENLVARLAALEKTEARLKESRNDSPPAESSPPLRSARAARAGAAPVG